MHAAEQRDPIRRLLGALVCVCLVVQPLLVPLHLALVEHGGGVPVVADVSHAHPHVHAHGHGVAHAHRHVHGNAHAAPPDSTALAWSTDDVHPSHPVEDHLGPESDPLQGPAAASDLSVVAAVPPSGPESWDVVVVARLLPCVARAPEHPPPRSAARPRAPPVVVDLVA